MAGLNCRPSCSRECIPLGHALSCRACRQATQTAGENLQGVPHDVFPRATQGLKPSGPALLSVFPLLGKPGQSRLYVIELIGFAVSRSARRAVYT